MLSGIIPIYDINRHKEIQSEMNANNLKAAIDLLKYKLDTTVIDLESLTPIYMNVTSSEYDLIDSQLEVLQDMLKHRNWNIHMDIDEEYFHYVVLRAIVTK